MQELYPFQLHFNKLVVAKVHFAKTRRCPHFQIPPPNARVQLEYLAPYCKSIIFFAEIWEGNDFPFLTLSLKADREWTLSHHFAHIDARSIYLRGVFHEEEKSIYLLRTYQDMDRSVGHRCDFVE